MAKSSPRGQAMIFALIALIVLAFIASGSLKRSQDDSSTAGNVRRMARVAEISESGLMIVARMVLDYYGTNKTIDPLLNSIQLGTSSGGQYTVLIADNHSVGGYDQDSDGNDATDFDKIFRLESTGTSDDRDEVVEAFLKIKTTETTPPDSSGIGAVGLCANNANIDHGESIQGDDYSLPSYPCSGSGCAGSASGLPAGPGLSYNSGTAVTISSGTPTGTPGTNGSAGIDCSEWSTFLTSTAAIAQTTYSAAAGPFNASDVATNFGTDAAPKVVVITGPGTARFNGNLFGNGILIIRNANVVFNGTFTYAGLIIIEDEGGGIDLGGTAQIFGSMMVLNSSTADSQVELKFGKKTPTHYSTAGLARAATALTNAAGSASIEVLAYRTVAN